MRVFRQYQLCSVTFSHCVAFSYSNRKSNLTCMWTDTEIKLKQVTQSYSTIINASLLESKLLQMPQSQGRDNRIPEHAMLPPTPAGFTPIMAAPPSLLGYPPIITHTAATPQGSPHATLESCGRGELNNRLTPAMALYGTTSDQPEHPQVAEWLLDCLGIPLQWRVEFDILNTYFLVKMAVSLWRV